MKHNDPHLKGKSPADVHAAHHGIAEGQPNTSDAVKGCECDDCKAHRLSGSKKAKKDENTE